MVVVHSRGGLGGVGRVMRPTYWTSLFLKVIGAARNSVSRAGQSNPSPMNELVPTISKGSVSAVWLASCSEISRRCRASFGRSVRRLACRRRVGARRLR